MGVARRLQARRIGRAAVAVALAVCTAVTVLTAQPLFRPFDKLRADPSLVEGRLKPEATQKEADLERQARAVCGSCHAYPPPDILPRDNWRDEFVRMMYIRE